VSLPGPDYTVVGHTLWLSGWNCQMQNSKSPSCLQTSFILRGWFSGRMNESCSDAVGQKACEGVCYWQGAQLLCLLAVADTPPNSPTALSCRNKIGANLQHDCIGNDGRRLVSDSGSLYLLAHFSRIADYVTILSVKTHQWHEKLDRLLVGTTSSNWSNILS